MPEFYENLFETKYFDNKNIYLIANNHNIKNTLFFFFFTIHKLPSNPCNILFS